MNSVTYKPSLTSAINCCGVLGAGLQKIVAGADAGSSGQSARGVAGGLQAEFLRGVGVQYVRREHSVFDDHGAARGDAFAVEGAGAEAADDGAVVDDGDAGSGDGLAEFSGEERCAAIDGVSVHAFENVLEDRGRDHGVEDDGNVLRFYFARAEAAKRALGGDFADVLGRLEAIQAAGDRVPVVALHGAFFILRDGDGGDGAIRPAIFADEAERVGEDFVAGGGVETSAFGILDARVGIERGFFGAASVGDALLAGQRVHVAGIKIEVAGERAELRGVGESGERIFGSNFRKFERGLQHAVEAVAGEIAGMGAGGALSVEDANADGTRAGFFQGLDLAEADEGGEFVAFADDALGGGGAALHGAADEVLGEVFEVSFEFRVSSF